jgi:hypothetical protein
MGPELALEDREVGPGPDQDIRRECLNHVLILGERHLRRILTAYVAYYRWTRTHLSLGKDAPDGRPLEPPEFGPIISIAEVGSLHHRYVRRAA